MYDNHGFSFDEPLECVVIDSKTRKKIVKFYAREYEQSEKSANFVGSGIASGGKLYAVATSEELDVENLGIESYKSQLIVEGEEYKIIRIRTEDKKLSKMARFGGKKERVFYLS